MGFLIIGYNLGIISEQALNKDTVVLIDALVSLQEWLEYFSLEKTQLYIDVSGMIKKFKTSQAEERDFYELRRLAQASWFDLLEEIAKSYR